MTLLQLVLLLLQNCFVIFHKTLHFKTSNTQEGRGDAMGGALRRNHIQRDIDVYDICTEYVYVFFADTYMI